MLKGPPYFQGKETIAIHPLVVLGGLALLDSINPSLLLVTMYLLIRPRPVRRAFVFLAGVFTAYFAVGVLLVLGFDAAWAAWSEYFRGPVAYALQGAAGGALLAYGVAAARPRPVRPSRGRAWQRRARAAAAAGDAGLFFAGVAVAGMEMTTAAPYLAATGLLTAWRWPLLRWAAALAAYNVVCLAPAALLVLLRCRLGDGFRTRAAGLEKRLRGPGGGPGPWIVGFLGLLLMGNALVYFVRLRF